MNSIRHFVQLTDLIGCAGQPTETQFALIAENGYQHVINLAMPNHADALTNEAELVTSLNMNYLHLPVAFDAPKPEQVRYFCHFMSALAEDKVFVHCIMNYRSSAFLYHYLTKMADYDEESAISPILRKWKPDPAWQKVLMWTREDIGL